MARLTGDAARKWLAENPGKGYFDQNTGKYVEPKRGGISNFLLGVSKPFRAVMGAPLEIAMDLASKARGEDKPAYKEGFMKLPFLTGTETSETREDPYLALAKGAAGVGSYFIPGGSAVKGLGGIARAAGKGAIAGGLGGFGYSRKGKEVEDTLKGGALGGVIGGGLQALKGAPGAIRSKGESMKQGADAKMAQLKAGDQALLKDKQRLIDTIDDQIAQTKKFSSGKSSQYLAELDKQIASGGISTIDDVLPISDSTRISLNMSPKEFLRVKESIIQDMASKNFPVGSADDIANSWADYLSLKFTEKGNVLTKVGDQMVDATRASQALKKISKIVGDDTTLSRALDDGLQEILGKGVTIDKVPKTLSAAQVTAIKELADEIGGGGGKLLMANTKTEISQQLLNKVRNVSRDIVTDIKPLDDILGQISDSYKFKPVINEAPIVAERIASKNLLQGQQQLGNLGQQRAREITRLGEKGTALAQKNQLRIQNLEQKKLQIADDLASATRDLSERYQFSAKLPWPLTELTQNKIPMGGDVRAPFASLGSKAGGAMSNISPNIDKGLGAAANIGQRAIPGIIGLGASMPQREGPISTESPLGGMGMGQTSQKLTVQQALSLAQQIMPTASESEVMSLAKMLMTESSPDVSVASISAQGALADIDKLVNIISENNGVPFSSALPFGGFSEEGQVYKNAARNVYDLVTRTRTGAALNQSEEEFYKQFVPGITDTPASIQDKIKRLQDLYSSLAGEISSTSFFPQQQISEQYGGY